MHPALRIAFAVLLFPSFAAHADSPASNGRRIVEISKFNELAGIFNLGQGAVRIVSIVSPTCKSCVDALNALDEIMQSIPGKRLRSYVVFVPMMDEDDRFAAVIAAGAHDDPRTTFFWDPAVTTGNAWKELVGISTPAWDVYFLYDTDATFDDGPNMPETWMHQHSAIAGPEFDSSRLKVETRALLASFEQRQSIPESE